MVTLRGTISRVMVPDEVYEHGRGNVFAGFRALTRAPARLGERFRGILFPTGNSTDYGVLQEPAAFPGLRWKDDFLLILQDCGFHFFGGGVYLEDGSVRADKEAAACSIRNPVQRPDSLILPLGDEVYPWICVLGQSPSPFIILVFTCCPYHREIGVLVLFIDGDQQAAVRTAWPAPGSPEIQQGHLPVDQG